MVHHDIQLLEDHQEVEDLEGSRNEQVLGNLYPRGVDHLDAVLYDHEGLLDDFVEEVQVGCQRT